MITNRRAARSRIPSRLSLCGILCLLPLSTAGCGPRAAVVEEFWPDGRPKLRKEVTTLGSGSIVDHGLYVRWFDNGNKEYEATYRHGKLHGTERAWHRNGKLWSQNHYEDGLRHGTFLAWDEEGRKRKQEEYRYDKPHGEWVVWDKEGRVKWQATFEYGVPMSQSHQDPKAASSD